MDKGCKECEDLRDNQVPRDPREGQVDQDPKDLQARKAQGEKKGLEGNLGPKEKQGYQENQERMDQLDRQEEMEKRVRKDRQEYLGRKETGDPRVLQVPVEPLVPPENLVLPDQPANLAPRELLDRGERKEMMENADHQGQQELSELRVFLGQEDRRARGVPTDHREPRVCQDPADPPDQ